MNLAFLAFTAKGEALAAQLAASLGGEPMRCGRPMGLQEWTARQFSQRDGLVYVGAAGIAVRAVAPHLKSKRMDPAVVSVDECARFAIPLVSGHWGGANELARRIARVCGAQAAVTTATDGNGLFAVDEWAKKQGCRMLHPEKVKEISAGVLAGTPVRVFSSWSITGEPPAEVKLVADGEETVRLDLRSDGREVLWLVPPIAVLGVGCKKGTSHEALEASLETLLKECGLPLEAICGVASIDWKQEEPGLVAFCNQHGWPLRCFSAQELNQVPGTFSGSAFVRSVVGVDTVCERSAVLAAGGGLYQRKRAGGGVTMAVAVSSFKPDWSWRNE